MVTKQADRKGRVTLGERFANRTVIVKEIDETEVVITLARIMPEREAWLFKNPKARAMVLKGLKQAKAGELAEAPDLNADEALARQLEGDA